MSQHMYGATQGNGQEVVPRKLELSLNPEDGSLLTAPLLSVLLASTDGLYNDLYQMAHGELEVISAQAANQDGEGDADEAQQQQQPQQGQTQGQPPGQAQPQIPDMLAATTRKEKLANLSFAQRRHEISARLAQHGKMLTHVAALTAAEASTEFGEITKVSTRALQHARTAWTQADEAQDAMYFFHAQLFPARQAPHDVYGACDVLLSGPSRLSHQQSSGAANSTTSGGSKAAAIGDSTGAGGSVTDDPTNITNTTDAHVDADAGMDVDKKKPTSVEAATGANGDAKQGAAHGPALTADDFDKPFDFNQQFWYDLPQDLRLKTDRYDGSPEDSWSLEELKERWHMAVRDKLVRGEVGMLVHQPLLHAQRRQWKISLRGGIVRLTHGQPKTVTISEHSSVDDPDATTNNGEQGTDSDPMNASGNTNNSNNNSNNNNFEEQNGTKKRGGKTKQIYPIEAILTVLSTNESPAWTLLSVDINASARTGESNHQLETSNRQRYDLHRLCALAMSREEVKAHKARNAKKQKATSSDAANASTVLETSTLASIAQPLGALFQMTHTFQLSWQLEILSAQAQSLRKVGLWSSPTGQANSMIVVTPVEFNEQPQQRQKSKDVLGSVTISFWTVDDRYGAPRMSDLLTEELDPPAAADQQSVASSSVRTTLSATGGAASRLPRNYLALTVRAEVQHGIRVSLSGAESVLEAGKSETHISSIIEELLGATSNPFSLSASAALLAATQLCAERRCAAVVESLSNSALPKWMSLHLERGSIAVAARVSYHGISGSNSSDDHEPAILFRLSCDARTGQFIPTFSRGSRLLQLMACNDLKATESTALRVANIAHHRRGRVATSTAGRAVRDAFESLSRSMNVLGQRVGVGGSWDDINDQASKLRDRSIQNACSDSTVSMITCCGMAAVYGLSSMAFHISAGIMASPDMAGDPLKALDGIALLPIPPLAILVEQNLIERSFLTRDGEKKKQAHTEQEQFGICCSVNTGALTLYPVNMKVNVDSPHALPNRTGCVMTTFQAPAMAPGATDEPTAKRQKSNGDAGPAAKQLGIIGEVERFAGILIATLELDDDE